MLTVIQDGVYIIRLLHVTIDYLKRILSNTVMNPLFLLPIAFKLALSGDKISSRKINEGNLNTETFTSVLPDAWTLIHSYRLQHGNTSFTACSSFLKQGRMQTAFQFEFGVLQKYRIAMFYLICPLVPRISVMEI